MPCPVTLQEKKENKKISKQSLAVRPSAAGFVLPWRTGSEADQDLAGRCRAGMRTVPAAEPPGRSGPECMEPLEARRGWWGRGQGLRPSPSG